MRLNYITSRGLFRLARLKIIKTFAQAVRTQRLYTKGLSEISRRILLLKNAGGGEKAT